ncbi:MAG: ATP-binding protein [Nitrospirae bacterium]|nr:ATP-binding protein [Nitrospirota bacterium]
MSLEALLKDSYEFKNRKNIFKDIITESKWEGIAFIALYDKKGKILLHSNENLIGREVPDEFIKTAAETGSTINRYAVLGTDERVFILDLPVHIKNTANILRLALRAYPVEGIIRQARLQVLGMAVVIGILWVIGYFFIRASRRAEELKTKMAERERLAVIGEMASVLAHEIRNPLGSIKGFAQYLKEQQSSRAVEQQTGYLDIIISESKRLETLTEDLLMYAKPVELKLEEFDIGRLIDEVIKSFDRSAGGIDITASVPSEIKVKSDRDKLTQVLANLINNAADAVADDGIIEVKAESTGKTLLLTIKDNGCGMDSETMQRAFEPFFTAKTRGTGLGLAIVDKLVKALGGKIELESEPLYESSLRQKGTVFKIELPC